MGDGALRVDRGKSGGELVGIVLSKPVELLVLMATSCACSTNVPIRLNRKVITTALIIKEKQLETGCPEGVGDRPSNDGPSIAGLQINDCRNVYSVIISSRGSLQQAVNMIRRFLHLPVDSECFRLSRRLSCSRTHIYSVAQRFIGQRTCTERNQLTRMRHDNYFGARSLLTSAPRRLELLRSFYHCPLG
ncbi:hypothetical protein RRG08_042543 [Elysia crispata]|uniref:Uncharacterized protein n=1 Tax=Elysia crispata TaxID=231223 RepID=A0AAE0XQB4_9GAST|nr:hypothetical protein RRG08_042543 [Elysia crispata]